VNSLHGVQAEISRHGNGIGRLCAPRREKTRMPNSVGPAVGEHAITVQWCERDPSAADDRKLTFGYYPMAEVTVINASEIRLERRGADEPKVLAAAKRVTRPRPRQSHVAAVRPNAQHPQQAEAQRKAAQTVFSPGSYALRARGSEVMPPYDALVGSGPSYCIGSLCSTVRLLAPGHAQVRARVGAQWHSSSPPSLSALL
jgi:hypothetical protein